MGSFGQFQFHAGERLEQFDSAVPKPVVGTARGLCDFTAPVPGRCFLAMGECCNVPVLEVALALFGTILLGSKTLAYHGHSTHGRDPSSNL